MLQSVAYLIFSYHHFVVSGNVIWIKNNKDKFGNNWSCIADRSNFTYNIRNCFLINFGVTQEHHLDYHFTSSLKEM